MAETLIINHAELEQTARQLSTLSQNLLDDAKTFKQTNTNLLASWQGTGSDAFATAAASLEGFVSAVAVVMFAESAALLNADTTFSDQDDAAASGIQSLS